MLSNQIISELESYGLKKEGPNKYRCKSNPFRPESNSNSFTIKVFKHNQVGWKDHVTGQKGGTEELCNVLNIPYEKRKQAEDTKKSYTSMDEYARAHGVTQDVLAVAEWRQSVVWDGWGDERKERPVLIYPTATGDRYRFIDGEEPRYKPAKKGYKRCWYGLKNVIDGNDTLVLCNGEISTVVAQHFGIPAFCFTGGEKPTIPDDLMPALRLKAKDKQIIIALDCDDTGRKAAQGIRKQLQKEGFNVIAKELMLSKGGDLADHCKLYTDTSMADLLECPDMLDDDELEDERSQSLRPSKPTDDELGDRVIEKWDGKYAYFYGQWYEYQNGVWSAIQSVRLDIWNELKLAKAEGIRPSDSKVSSIEKYIQLMLMVNDEQIDNRLDIINLQNGVFNLETETLEPHQQDQYMTSQLPFEYDPKAKPDVLWQFVQSAFIDATGETDFELVNLVQEAVGYSLTSNTDHRVSFWLVGESGTGKSVLMRVSSILCKQMRS
jgi:hypothetical protein